MKLTDNELNELKYHYVDRVVDNMSTKDLVQYVFDDMSQYVDNQSDAEFLEDCRNYWDDSFDDVIEEVKNMLILISRNLKKIEKHLISLLILIIQEENTNETNYI